MRDFDKVMKFLVTSAVEELLPLMGIDDAVSEWLNVELPSKKRKADLIARLRSGAILHIELQSGNDPGMAQRMLDYCVRIYELTGVIPHQFVLYFGPNEMRMENRIEGPGLRFAYSLIDMRSLDAHALLASGSAEAAILSLLAADCEPVVVSRRLHEHLCGDDEDRSLRLQELFLVLCSLRGLDGPGVLQMPLDIMDVPIIQEFWEKGKEEGRSLGKAEGIAEGKAEGMAELVLHLMTSKFGPLPQSMRERLAHASTAQLIGWADLVQGAQSLGDVFGPDRP